MPACYGSAFAEMYHGALNRLDVEIRSDRCPDPRGLGAGGTA